MRLKANLTLFAVAIAWGTGFVTQGIAAKNQLAFLFNGLSFILAAIILLPFFPKNYRISRSAWKWMLIAGLVLFIASALQQVGIYHTKIANAGFLTSLYIVFTPFLLWLGFKEKPHWIDILAVAGACLGAFLLSTSGSMIIHPGDGLELIGAIFWGLHVVILGKFAAKYDPIPFASGHFMITGIINLLIGLVFENASQLLLVPVIGAIGYRAFVSIGFGYTLQVWGQRHTPPTDAALILGLESVFAVIAGRMILNQTLLPIQLVGCVIILASVIFSQLKGIFLTHAFEK
ncbi:DMT family transporter [Chloroflexota bacterium]